MQLCVVRSKVDKTGDGKKYVITDCNRRFLRTLPEEEAVLAYFRRPEGDEPFKELTCAEMLEAVRMKNRGFRCGKTAAMSLTALVAPAKVASILFE